MQFYRHSRRSRLPCASYHAVRSLVVGEESSYRDGKGNSRIRELKSRVQNLEKNLKEVLDSVRLGIPLSCFPRRQPDPRTSKCFRCRKTGISGKSPAIQGRKTKGSAGEVVDHSLRSRGACQGVADEAPSGKFRTVCFLTPVLGSTLQLTRVLWTRMSLFPA